MLPVLAVVCTLLAAGVMATHVTSATDGLVGLLAGWAVVIAVAGACPSVAARAAVALLDRR